MSAVARLLRVLLLVMLTVMTGLVVLLGSVAWFNSRDHAAPSLVSTGHLTITQDGESLDFGYCSNGDLLQSNPSIQRVLVVVHSTSRDACDYANYGVESATAAGVASSTLVVAPWFASSDQLAADDTKTLYWDDGSTSWKSGDASLTTPLPRPWTISSYAALDQLVAEVNDTQRFPNLTRVVIAGHSTGGQLVNRYSLGAPAPSGTNTVTPQFVVMGPSSYLYLTPQRFVNGVFRTPTTAEVSGCRQYNEYKYGMELRNAYMRQSPVEAMFDRFKTRDVAYLLGELDNDPNDTSLDTGCQAMWQGTQRYERGTLYYRSLSEVLGPGVTDHQELVSVPGVGHDVGPMFASPEGQDALFGE